MNGEVELLVGKLIGEPCTQKEVGRFKSLRLGFGADSKNHRPQSEELIRHGSLEHTTANGDLSEIQLFYAEAETRQT